MTVPMPDKLAIDKSVLNPKKSGWEDRSVERVVASGRDSLLERSRRLVEAAYEILDQGLEELTIRSVLRETGLSRRVFYERFSGKDDLMLAVLEYTLGMAAQHYREQIGHLANPLERIRVIVKLLVLGREALDSVAGKVEGRRGAAMSREHLRLAESSPDELQLALEPLLSLLSDELAKGMIKGSIRQDDSRRMARFIYNLVSTTVHTELLASEALRSDREKLADDIWVFCRGAIAA